MYVYIYIYIVYLYCAQAQSTLLLRRPLPELVGPTHPRQHGSRLGPLVGTAPGPETRAGNNRPERMCQIETAPDHTEPTFFTTSS
jgi:hypothetical protein